MVTFLGIAKSCNGPKCPSASKWTNCGIFLQWNLLFSRSVMSDSAAPWTAACQASLSFTNSQEFSQTHVHWVSDAIQPSHPLSSPSPPASNLFQHQVPFLVNWLFKSGGQSIGASLLASVLPVNIQSWFPFGLTRLISLLSKALSRVFSNTTIQKHQFFSTQPSLWSSSHVHTWLLEKP